MADDADPSSKVPFKIPAISIDASVQAPLLYFEEASAYGHLSRVIRVTLEAMRMYPRTEQDGIGVTFERIAVAHLRMNIPAAMSLTNAIEAALLLAAPASSEARN